MSLSVHVLHLVSIDAFGNEFRKVCLVFGRILLLEYLHVLFDVVAENPLLVCFCIILALLTLLPWRLEAGEILGAVGDVQAAVHSTLQRTPHAVANASATQAHIQDALEG